MYKNIIKNKNNIFIIGGVFFVVVFSIIFIGGVYHLNTKDGSMAQVFSEKNTQKIQDEQFVLVYERALKFMGYFEEEVKNRKKWNDEFGLKNLEESHLIWENFIKSNEQRYIKLKEKGIKGLGL